MATRREIAEDTLVRLEAIINDEYNAWVRTRATFSDMTHFAKMNEAIRASVLVAEWAGLPIDKPVDTSERGV